MDVTDLYGHYRCIIDLCNTDECLTSLCNSNGRVAGPRSGSRRVTR